MPRSEGSSIFFRTTQAIEPPLLSAAAKAVHFLETELKLIIGAAAALAFSTTAMAQTNFYGSNGQYLGSTRPAPFSR